jgi:chromosome segregation ATPase
MIEDLLKEILSNISGEKASTVEEMNARKVALDGYLQSLQGVIAKIAEASTFHRIHLVNVMDERLKEESALQQAKDAHAKENENHEAAIRQKSERVSQLDSTIVDRETKHNNLDNKIQGLVVEHGNMSQEVTSLRGQVSTLERANRTLSDEQRSLTLLNEKLKSENVELESSIETKKKDFIRLSGEVTTLEARLK